MKIVLLSDLHLKVNQYRDIYLDDFEGIFYPLINLTWAKEISNKENADAIFILGDVFDRPSNDHRIIGRLYRTLKLLSQNCQIFILLGNHDIQNLDGESYSTLETFENIVNIVTEPYIDHSEKIILVPYNHKNYIYDILDGSFRDYILFTHIGINGFEYTRGIPATREEFNINMFSNFSMVFTGHFHHHNIRNNVYYLGSPWPVRVDELGSQKFIHVVDTNNPTNIKKYNAIYSSVEEKEIRSLDDINFEEIDSIFRKNPYSKLKLKLKDVRLISSVDSIVKNFGISRVYYSIEEDYSKNTDSNTPREKTKTTYDLTIEKLVEGYLTEEEKDYINKVMKSVEEFVTKGEGYIK